MIKFKIYQLVKIGKKLKLWIIRGEEKCGRIESSVLIYGPTTLQNCKNKLKYLKKRGGK